MLKIRNGRDFVGGLTMILIALLFVWFGRDLQVGNSFQMGPGYFPIMLSLLLMVIGVLIIAQSILLEAEASEPEQWNWKAYAFIILGPIGFGLLLAQLGLAPATFLMVVAVATASRYANWRHSILLGLFLAICSAVLFTRFSRCPSTPSDPGSPSSAGFFRRRRPPWRNRIGIAHGSLF